MSKGPGVCYSSSNSPDGLLVPYCEFYNASTCCLSESSHAYVAETFKRESVRITNNHIGCTNLLKYVVCAGCSPNSSMFFERGKLRICESFTKEIAETCSAAYIDNKKWSDVYPTMEDWAEYMNVVLVKGQTECFTKEDGIIHSKPGVSNLIWVIIAGVIIVVGIVVVIVVVVMHKKKDDHIDEMQEEVPMEEGAAQPSQMSQQGSMSMGMAPMQMNQMPMNQMSMGNMGMMSQMPMNQMPMGNNSMNMPMDSMGMGMTSMMMSNAVCDDPDDVPPPPDSDSD